MILLIAFLTSALSAIFGMAGGLILMGVYAAMLPVAAAMVLHGFTQIVANGSRALRLWRHVDRASVLRYALGACVAVMLLGSVRYVPSTQVVFLTLGAMPFLSQLLPWKLDFSRTPVLAGAVVGGVQLIAGVGGPLLDLFFVNSMMDRHQVVATKAATQTLSHLLKISYFAAMLQGEVAPPETFVGLAVVAVAGTWAGGQVLERMSDTNFRRWTRWIVWGVGASYLVRGVMYHN